MKDKPVVTSTLLSSRPSVGSGGLALFVLAILWLCNWLHWNGWGEWEVSQRAVMEEGKWWRLWSSLFAHSDMSHLLGNSLPFWGLGMLLHGYYGLTVFPLGAFLLGGVVQGLTVLTYPPEVRLLGASGLVYAMLGFWLALYCFIDRRTGWGGRLLRASGFAAIFILPTQYDPSTSYRAHFIGLGLGGISGTTYFLMRRKSIRARETVEWEPAEENGEFLETENPEGLS